MKKWPIIDKGKRLNKYLQNYFSILYWKQIFKLVYEGKINSWAYVWTYTAFNNQKLTIVPNVNLVSNIGYGRQATNTFFKMKTMGMKTTSMDYPLSHPNCISVNNEADAITERNVYLNPLVVTSLLIRSLIRK
jgi:hypothetical protein